jgi:uncharacterized membrane protein
MSRSRFALAIVEMVVWGFLGIGVFIVDEVWLNWVLRAGAVFYSFMNALFPFIYLHHGPVPKLLRMSPIRVLQVRVVGNVVASTLTCIGALITWSAVGYLVAACAFGYGWIFWWIMRKAGLKPWAKLPVSTNT